MKLDFCVACGYSGTADLHQHHLVPRALGGKDDAANLITLCVPCHGRIHGLDLNHRYLMARGSAGKPRAKRKSREKTIPFNSEWILSARRSVRVLKMQEKVKELNRACFERASS